MTSLENLKKTIVRCKRCPRLVRWRREAAENPPSRYADMDYWGKPLPGFGVTRARLLIVGLAPAAHGGNRTGRMFTGDRSGDWLFEALHAHGFANQPTSVHRRDGLKLQDCYITAAVRCAPPLNKPTREEFETCRPYLTRELRLLKRVRVVVALGGIAFDAFFKAFRENEGEVPRPKPRFHHGACIRLEAGPTLMASYHPSQQNTFTGKLTREMFDEVFSRARSLLE
ncbi:MAG TPA: uracil-DNA glycosylase [Candidatus Binatia bacterium]